jgi:H+/Cl- antiporter ClcA
VGTTTGALLGTLLNLPTELFAVLGLAGVLAGAINTPITAVLLAIELFGLPVGAYVIVICAISFLISGHRSAIPTQLLAINKAPAIQTVLKEEIGKTKSEIKPWSEQLKSYQERLKRYTFRNKKSGPNEKEKKNSGP